MVQKSGQSGVPVITVDSNVIVGFDQPRLERLIPAAPARGRLGAAVRSQNGGLLVGTVHPGSPAEKAGLRPNDLIRTISGASVATPEQLQDRFARPIANGQPIELQVLRDGKPLSLRLNRN